MDRRTRKTDITDTLTAEEAGRLLDMSGRHVRRMIARGDLEGARDPYRTTRAAVDAYRFRQRTKGGDEVRTSSPEPSTDLDHGDGHADQWRRVLSEAHASIERLARENGWLQREVTRLEAELAQCRVQASERRTPTAERQPGAQRGGMLRRVGLWLRRRS